MDRIPLNGVKSYSYSQSVWENNNMQKFSDFRKCYNKDVVPTLEAMQKMIEFYHNKANDMLKLGCRLLNLAIICLHKSTDSKCYTSTGSDKDLFEKIREDMVGGPSIVFTRKAVLDETFILKASNLCFDNFVQSAVDARRQGDENPTSSVIAETVKLLANSSYGYQIMDRSRHTVTKYLTDEKTNSAIDNKIT